MRDEEILFLAIGNIDESLIKLAIGDEVTEGKRKKSTWCFRIICTIAASLFVICGIVLLNVIRKDSPKPANDLEV